MNLMDLLESSGGGGSVGALAKQLGVSSADTGNLVGALAPALMRGLQKQTENPATMAGLTKALASGKHQRYLDNPDLMADEETRNDGNRILGHIFGSKDVSRNVAADAAKSTGIDASLIRKALPILAGLAMGAIGRKGQAESKSNDPGVLGGLLGGLLGGGDSKIDDVLKMARKFF